MPNPNFEATPYPFAVRLLFVSSTSVGGSGRSQRELAARLVARGNEVVFLIDDELPAPRRRWLYEQLSDLSVRFDCWPGGGVVRWMERLPGRRTRTESVEGLRRILTPVPENAFEEVIESFKPDVVVGNSLVRLSWKKVRRSCAEHSLPTVLYVREASSLNHFGGDIEPPDRIVANSGSLAGDVEALGLTCAMVPSVIEVGVTQVESTRRVALVINPIESHGIDLVWQVAERLPEVSIVLQESWPLDAADLDRIYRHLHYAGNVVLRRAASPGPRLYGDARVLLVPHRIDNRPRVIAEAQANGIPVVASMTPGLAEAVGNGGVLVGAEDLDGWCEVIQRLWSDELEYENLVECARDHGSRPELDPGAVAERFEGILLEAVEALREREADSAARCI